MFLSCVGLRCCVLCIVCLLQRSTGLTLPHDGQCEPTAFAAQNITVRFDQHGREKDDRSVRGQHVAVIREINGIASATQATICEPIVCCRARNLHAQIAEQNETRLQGAEILLY